MLPSGRRGLFLALILLALVSCSTPPAGGGAPGLPNPSATPAPTSTTIPAAPPRLLLNGVVLNHTDLCSVLSTAPTGATIVVSGSRSRPLDLGQQPSTTPTGECRIFAYNPDVVVKTEGNPLILGSLIINNPIRWRFDGLAVTRSALSPAGVVVEMVGGTGWRWTNCEVFGSGGYADMGVGHWTGNLPPTDFRIDHCFFHDNPGSSTHAGNQDHNIYVFTEDGIDARGVIEQNTFLASPRGYNVKIGGTGLRPGEGTDGLVFRNNTLVNNRADGSNVLIATDSDGVTLSNNVFVSQGHGDPVVNVGLGSFSGSLLVLDDNIFWGYDPNLYPAARPILWSNNGSYASINLNQPSWLLVQNRNVRFDPGYPALGATNPDRSKFPPVTTGGVTYGRTE